MSTNTRRAGDPLPGALVRQFRTQAGLTQDELAERLGVRGGKPVVSGWETNRTTCEGPAAELLLHLFGSMGASLDALRLDAEISTIWTRASRPVEEWRQVTVVPDPSTIIPGASFVTLFPEAALDDGWHGFPFVARGLPADVCGITQNGWLGCIPQAADFDPRHLWMLKRDGRFAFRESLWEVDPLSVTRGQIDAASVLKLALEATYFLRGLATRCAFAPDLRVAIQIDVEGVRGRHLVAVGDLGHGDDTAVRWNESRATSTIIRTVADVHRDPVAVGVELTADLAAQTGRRFAERSELLKALNGSRRLGHGLPFLDADLPLSSRRAG